MSTTLDPVERLDSQNAENSVTDQLVSQEVQDSVASKISTDKVPEVKSFVKLNGNTKTVKLSDDTVVNLSDVAYNGDGEG